jgi:hypothetical protein
MGTRQELPLRESGDYPPEFGIFLKQQLTAALYAQNRLADCKKREKTGK